MAFQWTDDLETGFHRVDSQHRELIDRFNTLIESCKVAKGREGLPELLDFLDNYVRFHFGEEEAMMRSYNYPDMEQHLEQHRIYLNDVAEMKRQFHEQGASTSLLIQLNTSLMNWIVDHIKKLDTKLGHYLAECNGQRVA